MENTIVNQITFLWSIVSTITAIGFFGWDVWQLASSRKNEELQLKEKQLHKSQVKIWQHFANGINHNLLIISEALRIGKLSNLEIREFGEILNGVQASTNALYTSLNEERLFTEEEIKQRQLDQEEHLKNLLKQPSVSVSPSANNTHTFRKSN